MQYWVLVQSATRKCILRSGPRHKKQERCHNSSLLQTSIAMQKDLAQIRISRICSIDLLCNSPQASINVSSPICFFYLLLFFALITVQLAALCCGFPQLHPDLVLKLTTATAVLKRVAVAIQCPPKRAKYSIVHIWILDSLQYQAPFSETSPINSNPLQCKCSFTDCALWFLGRFETALKLWGLLWIFLETVR